MGGNRILETQLRDHENLRARLQEWEAALLETAGGNYRQAQQAVSALRELCRFFEREGWHHFREEETVLYAAVEFKLPRLRALVGELRSEHDAFRQAFEDFRRELIHFNATGHLRQLPRLGRELVGILRRHLEREEGELHPVVLREFKEEDWHELRRIFVDSQVA